MIKIKNQYYYKRLLSKGIMYVEFIKKDGSLRKMYCTRDNKVIQESGHDLIQFNQNDLVRRENRFKNHLFVYDLQEKDTRILNIGTISESSIRLFADFDEVAIPDIVSRFEKRELGIVDEEIKPDIVEEVELTVSLEDKALNLSDSSIDDIFK